MICAASSARLRSVMSVSVPTIRTTRPPSFRTACAPGQKPAHTAVLVHHAMLIFEVRGLTVDVGLHPGQRNVFVVGMESAVSNRLPDSVSLVLESENGLQLTDRGKSRWSRDPVPDSHAPAAVASS